MGTPWWSKTWNETRMFHITSLLKRNGIYQSFFHLFVVEFSVDIRTRFENTNNHSNICTFISDAILRRRSIVLKPWCAFPSFPRTLWFFLVIERNWVFTSRKLMARLKTPLFQHGLGISTELLSPLIIHMMISKRRIILNFVNPRTIIKSKF